MISTTQANVNFRHLFKDLVQGWSEIRHSQKSAFLKHLSVFDQVDIEELRGKYIQGAKERGLPTQADALERLREEEMWTSSDDTKVKQQEEFLKHAETSKKQFYLKKEIDNANEEIIAAQLKLAELLMQKESLLGQTCEKYADSRVSDHYILKSAPLTFLSIAPVCPPEKSALNLSVIFPEGTSKFFFPFSSLAAFSPNA